MGGLLSEPHGMPMGIENKIKSQNQKRQSYQWMKVFAHHLFDKGMIPITDYLLLSKALTCLVHGWPEFDPQQSSMNPSMSKRN